jgi:hypothetical protein
LSEIVLYSKALSFGFLPLLLLPSLLLRQHASHVFEQVQRPAGVMSFIALGLFGTPRQLRKSQELVLLLMQRGVASSFLEVISR